MSRLSTPPQNLNIKLKQRGIDKAAAVAGWTDDGQRWHYLVTDPLTGVTARRSKAGDSGAKPKYLWHGSSGATKPEGLNYYAPQGLDALLTAIADNDGTLIIANGEPAVLTVLAADRNNVLSWFGEKSIPATLITDLPQLGVKRVLYAADTDKPGIAAAAKLRSTLRDSGIEFKPLQLPFEVTDKHGLDTNDLWITTGFNPSAFWETFDNLPALILPESATAPAPKPTDFHYGDFPPAFIQAVESAVENMPGFKRWLSNGWANFRSPFRDEKNASAGYNRKTHSYNDFGGESMGVIAFAAKLGIYLHNFVEKKPTITRRRASKKRQQTSAAGEVQTPTAPEEEKPNPLAWKAQPVKHLTGAELINVQYLTADMIKPTPDKPHVIVKSDTGTNKTGAIADLISEKDKVLGIAPLIRLVESLSKRLDLMSYNDELDGKRFTPSQLRSMEGLATTPHSLYRLAIDGAALPVYDFVVLDEWTRILTALVGKNIPHYRRAFIYEVFRGILRAAKHVIVLDADLDDESLEFLYELLGRDNFRIVENTYQRQRGNLTVYEKMSRDVHTAFTLADETNGLPVAVATNSKKLSVTLHRQAVTRYGEAAVLLINADTVAKYDQQRLIAAITRRDGDVIQTQATALKQYRMIIYTPSIGTGIDIQAPVRAVVGIFRRFRRDAMHTADYHQMLARFRHAGEAHVYCQNVAGNDITDANELIRVGLEKDFENGRIVAELNANGELNTTPTQKAIHRLQAMVWARRNRSANDHYQSFMNAATGYASINYVYSDDNATKQQLTATGEVIAAEWKALVLSSEPLTVQQFDRIPADQQTDQHRAGLERGIIEDATGQELTPVSYDLYHDPDNQSALHHFVNIKHATLKEVTAIDAREKHKRHLLELGLNTRKKELWTALEAELWGEGGFNADKVLTAGDIAAALYKAGVTNERLYLLYNRRKDSSTAPAQVLKWLLSKVGLKLDSTQVMQNGERQRVYKLNADQLETTRAYAVTSYQRRIEKAAAITQNPILYLKQYMPESSNQGSTKTPATPPQPASHYDPYEDTEAVAATERRVNWEMLG